MAQKCVHKGCEKQFTDPEEPCNYHPGPPIFHEGQKGWKCCKPRMLTFDEFLAIPPCTTGKHSTVVEAPPPAPKPAPANVTPTPAPAPSYTPTPAPPAAAPKAAPISSSVPTGDSTPSAPKPAVEEDEDDDPAVPVPAGSRCKRRGCGAEHNGSGSREGEKCVYHPGQPIFHEGSKGWICCRRRVLEFDEFMKIPGCKEKDRHLFVGKRKEGEEKVDKVRNDFYQTSSTVNVSLYLKKVNKDSARISFHDRSIDFDLPTTDNKRYSETVPLFASIEAGQSTAKIMGTKVELMLRKADGTSWPVLRSDEPLTGEILQVGQARRA